MSADDPGAYVMPLGKYTGQALDKIAERDEGLLYLDWAVGEFKDAGVRDAITAYLSLPSIASELRDLLDERGT